MKKRVISGVAAIVLSLGVAGTASASSTLPAKNTAHRCVHHTTGVCGWTHGVRPANSTETAKCKDATLSYSRHSRGTCSYHRGVRYWFK